MGQPDAAALLSLAESIADGSSVDWAAVEARAAADDQGLIRQLRILADLATLHRTLPTGPDALPNAFASRRTAAAPAIGRWAHLDLIERIGGGTFGEVYRAWDRHLECEVALKLLHATGPVDDPLASRIVTEGRLLARARHANVVAVHGVAVHDGRVGLWMELVNGPTLEQVLQQNGPFSAREAAVIGIDLCRALAAIHRAGLVHRDVKTQNVVREQGGRIVLMDLGTGRELDPTHPALSDLAGTPLYLAPEIFDGRSASERTDLYSLGVLLYRLVTGAFPVRAAAIDDLRAAHAKRATVRLRDARPDLPTAFVRVVDWAIAGDPQKRYASAGEFEAELAKSLEDSGSSHRSSVSTGRSIRAILASLLILTALAVTVAQLGLFRSRTSTASSESQAPLLVGQISTIAVLPFDNLSTDSGDEYLASAVPMELTTRLGRIGAVKVIPWTFVKKRFDAGDHNLIDIARRTGAQAVIEGSVQQVPSTTVGQKTNRLVQVRVQLYEASAGSLMWSDTFERDISDFFGLQLQIAQAIAGRIHVVLATRERMQLTRSRRVPPEAMELYLNARYAMDVQTNVKRAVELLQRSVQIEPNFAEAYAALASYNALESAYFSAVPSSVALRRALDASTRAIAIDSGLAEAWGARAFAHFALEWNWPAAESDFQHALNLDPNSVDVLGDYSDYLSHHARHDEAIDAARKAEDRAPMSVAASRQLAYAYYMARRYDDAIRQLDATLAIESDYVPAHTLLGRVCVLTGRTSEGLAHLEVAGDQRMLAWGYAMAGRHQDSEQLLDTLRTTTSAYWLAVVYAALGQPKAAVNSLEAAFREKDPSLTALGVDPMIDPIRSQPKVRDLLDALKLP